MHRYRLGGRWPRCSFLTSAVCDDPRSAILASHQPYLRSSLLKFEGENTALSQSGRVRLLRGLFPLFLGLTLAACATPQVQPYETLDAGSLMTTVQGQATFLGTSIPDVQFSKIYRDSNLCGEEVTGEELNVAEGSRGIEGVIVSLEGIAKGKPEPKKEVIVIENRGCRFIPYVNATAVGSTLQIQNTDPILHNTHARFESRFGRTIWNIAQPAGAQGISKSLVQAGLVDVRCDLHPNMRSYIQVFEHPYFTITDPEGFFEFKSVPAGTYQLTAWHARLGSKGKSITVPQSGTVMTDIGMLLKR